MKGTFRLFQMALALSLPSAICTAAETAAWTANNRGTAGPALDFSLGFRFTAKQPIQVTHLGRVDYNGNGLAVPALARLYNWQTGVSLGEVTIPAGMSGRETNGTLPVHYAALPNPITLEQNVDYLLAVEATGGDFGYDIDLTMAEEIEWIEGRATPVGSPAMPSTADTTTFSIGRPEPKCYMGASFKFASSAPPTNQFTLALPRSRQVVQRNASNRADLVIQGTLSGNAARVEARAVVMPGSTNNGVPMDWTVVAETLAPGRFTAVLPAVAAGGWYRIEVRALDSQGNVMASAEVDRVGVGDVFITAGQSNAGCFGSPTQKPTDNRVSAYTLSSGAWQLANDPQPNISGFMGTGGSAWPILGSRLVASNQVPVGFIGLAYGATTVLQWAPGTPNFRNLTNTLVRFGTNGVRAVLWHQGESDSLESTSAASYAQRLSNIVARARASAGWSVPWGIAEVSYHPSATRAQEEPVAAGQRLFLANATNCFRGPRTDDFYLEKKVSTTDGVHFTAAGLTDHADQWLNILLGHEDLSPKNGDFESNTALPDGRTAFPTRVIGWNRLNNTGTALARGNNGYFNPDPATYSGTADTNNDGILPNMSGRHAASLQSTTNDNSFLQTLKAHLKPSTIYTLQVAVGVRDNAEVFGGYRLELLANGAPLGPGAIGDLQTLSSLAGGSATGAFTVVSCVYTSGVPVPTNQQLAIRITKPGGAGTYLDFDNVRLTTRLTHYGEWQGAHWGGVTLDASVPAADPDGDGLPNLCEYGLLGMDPKSMSPMPLPILTEVSGEPHLRMQLLKDPTATLSRLGLRLSYDLVNWFYPTNSPDGAMTILENPNEFTVLLRRSAIPFTFFRVEAQP